MTVPRFAFALFLAPILTITSPAAAGDPAEPGPPPSPAPMAPLPPPVVEPAPASELTPPPAEVASPPPPGASTPAPEMTASPAFRLFLDQYIHYDAKTGQATRGQAKTPLGREDLYVLIGRPDLVGLSRVRIVERSALFVTAAAVFAGGLALGFHIREGIPNLNSADCWKGGVGIRYDQDCSDSYRSHEAASTAVMVGGFLLGGAIATIAGQIPIDGISRSSIAGLVASYNGSVMERLRARETEQPRSSRELPRAHLAIMPSFDARGGGISARLTF